MKTDRNSVAYSFNHVKERMLERHNLDITQKEYEELCNNYLNKPILIDIIGYETNQKVFRTGFKTRMLTFVWCEKRKRISTVLPS